ncbi:MAG: (2Fe-2S)-binding protein [Chloroflexi bacterium]|nr:MAG: (2Fe-2S)-binding protein [Chloroflexota bacterium]
MKHPIRLKVNGNWHELHVEPHETLLEVLRRDLGVAGAREACGIGICGACTVLVEDQPISACLLPAPLADGQAILTVEGLSQNGELDPVQEAFIEEMGFQCGYCTPGMILTARALLAEDPTPGPDRIREYLAGNLCRCGSYVKILAAVQSASRKLIARDDAVL